jgi:hypothetical protein
MKRLGVLVTRPLLGYAQFPQVQLILGRFNERVGSCANRPSDAM